MVTRGKTGAPSVLLEVSPAILQVFRVRVMLLEEELRSVHEISLNVWNWYVWGAENITTAHPTDRHIWGGLLCLEF